LADDVPFIPIVRDLGIASGGALNGIIKGAFRRRYPNIRPVNHDIEISAAA
jgi:hypothetical protein